MNNNLIKELLAAAGKNCEDLPENNIYRKIAFDGDKSRMGWVKPAPFSLIKQSLEKILPVLEGKEAFIFIGMGGSINGIKPLLSLWGSKKYYTLENLDPRAVSSLSAKIKDFTKALVIPISKSGTTKETQLLSLTLKELFTRKLGRAWEKNFLCLSDPQAFDKLNSLGWQEITKLAIQFDSGGDIGGRFSSPNTLIFFLPLFLLLEKDFNRLEKIYNLFLKLEDKIRDEAYQKAFASKDKPKAYFAPLVSSALGESFSSWIIQLFQESLGSKSQELEVKTIPNLKSNEQFYPLQLDLEIKDKTVKLMAQMYFFQMFIAYYSALKKINFVSQSYVEEYKHKMRQLEGEENKKSEFKRETLNSLVQKVEPRLTEQLLFIEVVLYFYPKPGEEKAIKASLDKAFPDKQVLVFIGSDWNHQSYQAAFAAKDTFYILLVADKYEKAVTSLSEEITARNVGALKLIAEATYLTLKDKAILAAIER